MSQAIKVIKDKKTLVDNLFDDLPPNETNDVLMNQDSYKAFELTKNDVLEVENNKDDKEFLIDLLSEKEIGKIHNSLDDNILEQKEKVTLKDTQKNKQMTLEEMEVLEKDLKLKNFLVYKKLFKEEIYSEIFKEIEKNFYEIDNEVMRKKYLKDAFRFVLHVENIDYLAENKKLIFLSKEIVKQFRYSEFLKKEGVLDNLEFYFQAVKCKVIFVDLFLNKDLDDAKFMLQFFDPNLKDFKNTIEVIKKNNNTDLLRFLCENMTNINFNNGELLRKSVFMDFNAVNMLINEFNFDINDEDEFGGGNVFQVVVEAGKTKVFEGLVKNYSKELNILKPMKVNKLGELNLIRLIEKKCNIVKQYEFLSIILDKTSALNLPKPALKYIGNILFESEFMSKYHNTDIYEKFFQQKEFSHEDINLGQRYFLYGMLSSMGEFLKVSPAHNESSQIERYFNVIQSFLKHSKVDDIPPAINYHIVGAAVEIASFYDETIDILNLILNKYQKYVNKPNPNGLLPIQQIIKNSTVYSVLIEHGAISIDEEEKPSFFSTLFKAFEKNKKPNRLLEHIQEMNEKIYENMPNRIITTKEKDITQLFDKIKSDFMDINEFLSKDGVDLELKSESENLYFKTIGLVKTLENKSGTTASLYEEVHFLNQNFSNYLKKSIEKYVDLLKIYENQNNKITEEKLDKGKSLCIEQIKILQKQVDVFIENILNNSTDEKLQSLNIQKRFLTEKFPEQVDEKQIKIRP